VDLRIAPFAFTFDIWQLISYFWTTKKIDGVDLLIRHLAAIFEFFEKPSPIIGWNWSRDPSYLLLSGSQQYKAPGLWLVPTKFSSQGWTADSKGNVNCAVQGVPYFVSFLHWNLFMLLKKKYMEWKRWIQTKNEIQCILKFYFIWKVASLRL